MAGTRLSTQLAFAAGAILLLLVLLDCDSIGCMLECFDMRPHEYDALPAGFLLEYDIYNAQGTDEFLFPSFDSGASVGRRPAIYALDARSDRPRIRLNFFDLTVACRGGVSGEECPDMLRDYEQTKVNELLQSPRLSFREQLSITLILSYSEHISAHTVNLFDLAVSSFASQVETLSAVMSIRVNTQTLRWGSRAENEGDDSSAAIDVEDIFVNRLPAELKVKRGLRPDADISLVVYFPAGMPGITSNIGYVSKESDVGLLLAAEMANNTSISDVLMIQLRTLLGLSVSELRDAGEAEVPFPPAGFFVVATGQVTSIDGALESAPALSYHSARISPWEVRWMQLARVHYAGERLGHIAAEVEFHCKDVTSWSVEQHQRRYLLREYEKVAEAIDGLSRLHALPLQTSNYEHTFYNAVKLAAIIEQSSKNIGVGGNIHKPSLFPADYKIAIYAPFWVPIVVPLLQGIVTEYRRYALKTNAKVPS